MARLARDPWRLRLSMRELNDDEGNPLITDREKAEALEKRHFHWDKDGRQLEDTEAKEGGRETEELRELEEERVTPSYSKQELKSKLRKALQRTSNTSAPGPNGMSYRFIKALRDTIFEDELLTQLAKELQRGRAPMEWQLSKVVMIPK